MAYFMENSDIDIIKEHVSIEDVVDFFGIEKKKIGQRTSVLCPFHNDEHFGSAFLWNDRISCHVCGMQYDIFDVWAQMTGQDFFESLKDIAERFQVPVNLNREDQKKNKTKEFPFSKSEMELIFPKMDEGKKIFPVNLVESRDDAPQGCTVIPHYEKLPDGEYGKAFLAVRKCRGNSLSMMRDFYQEDPKAFLELIYRKCKDERYPFYLRVFQDTKERWGECLHRGAEGTYMEFLEHLMLMCTSRLNEVKEIFQKTKRLY